MKQTQSYVSTLPTPAIEIPSNNESPNILTQLMLINLFYCQRDGIFSPTQEQDNA